MVIPFVTTSEVRMKNMMTLLEAITPKCSFILFKFTDDLRRADKSPDPVALLDDEWNRLGLPPFCIERELGSARNRGQ